MSLEHIKSNVENLLKEIPPHVRLVAVVKTRTPEEIKAAVDAGVKAVGENYIVEAEEAFNVLGKNVSWHFVGHLQKNKVKRAVRIFDMVETVDSVELAGEINKRSREIGKIMPVLIEVNSAREKQKSGVFPENTRSLIESISGFGNIRISGLMTMGPLLDEAEAFRPYFAETRKLFEELKSCGIPGVDMKYLSMGMTGSYRVAIEEGANIVRIGTAIFGERA